MSKKPLSLFKLVMMAVVAIDSLKNLPFNAQYGMSLIIYYLAAMLVFFIPSALITAELATSIPDRGGAYRWIYNAFGQTHAFMAAWMQWLIMLIWAPTILSFIVSTALYWLAPSLIENRMLMFFLVVALFWFGLGLISRGMYLSGQVSTICAVVGVILPMFAISVLGITWLVQGHPSNIHVSLHPSMKLLSSEHLRLFIPLLYSLMGMEMIAIHVENIDNPQRNYPRALLITSSIIFSSVVCASLAIAIVIPKNEMHATVDIVKSFELYLHAFGLNNVIKICVASIVIGSFGIFYTWLLTVSQYLKSAGEDGSLPAFMQTRYQLIAQGIIATLVSGAFILMPSVNYAFWLLSVSCAQFGLMYYIYLFASAIYLRFKQPNLVRPFRVGKGNGLLICLCSTAILTSIISIGFGFIPPSDMRNQYFFRYELSLAMAIVSGLGVGLLIYCLFRFTSKDCVATI